MPSTSSSSTPVPALPAFDTQEILLPQPLRPNRQPLAALLLVEPDALVRELLTASLQLHRPGWRVEAVADPDAAGRRLADGPPVDLLMLEPALPDARRGAALVQQVRGRATRLPILLLTALPEEAWRRGLDVDAVLVKPPDMDQLVLRVERLLALHRGSIVRGIALGSLLQMLEIERKSCTLAVDGPAASGCLWVRDGRLAHAETRLRRGRDAFFEMLDWSSPVVHVADRCELPAGRVESLQQLLLEHAIARDQHGRD